MFLYFMLRALAVNSDWDFLLLSSNDWMYITYQMISNYPYVQICTRTPSAVNKHDICYIYRLSNLLFFVISI